MSGHQRWLEQPYEDMAREAEAYEAAREAGFSDPDEMWEAMKEEAELEKWERENDR